MYPGDEGALEVYKDVLDKDQCAPVEVEYYLARDRSRDDIVLYKFIIIDRKIDWIVYSIYSATYNCWEEPQDAKDGYGNDVYKSISEGGEQVFSSSHIDLTSSYNIRGGLII